MTYIEPVTAFTVGVILGMLIMFIIECFLVGAFGDHTDERP